MRYRNKITGIEFETKCVISGEDFEPVLPKKVEEPKPEPKEEPKVKETKPKTTAKRTKK